MNALRIALCSLLLLIATAPLMAQGTYTQIDVPGAAITYPLGINTAGDVSGWYQVVGGGYHGFLLRGGVYTTVDYPGLGGAFLTGLNDVGQAVGFAVTAHGYVFGFLYDIATATFTDIIYPRSLNTLPYAINNNGTVAGYYLDHMMPVGFELVGSTYIPIIPPQANDSQVYGISTSGVLAGYVRSLGGGYKFFRYQHGKMVITDTPHVPIAQLFGINPQATAVVGSYATNAGLNAGFLYQNKILTRLQFPGAAFTEARAINSAGEVVGVFADVAGDPLHGFIWAPSAEPEP